MEDKEKSLYLTQIRFLDEQLERFQMKCDELQKQSEALRSLYVLQQRDKADIAEYLRHSATQKEKEAEQLLERLETQRQDAGRDEEALKLQHRRELKEKQDQVDTLSLETKIQALKLEEQTEQVEELKQLIQHQPDIQALRKEMEGDKILIFKLKEDASKDKLKTIRRSRRAARRALEMKKPEILQERTEHCQLLEKIQPQLKENAEIADEKLQLQIRERVMSEDMDNTRKTLDEVSRVIANNKKDEEELRKRRRRLEVKMKELNITKERTLAEEEALREGAASTANEVHQKASEVDELEAEVQEERSRRRRLEDDLKEAAAVLRHALTDSEETSDSLQRLLKILGKGPAPNDPAGKSRPQTLDLATDPLFLLARYRPGDLGFVPRPTWKHRPGRVCSSVDPSGPEPIRSSTEH